jgi:hypothetical protein
LARAGLNIVLGFGKGGGFGAKRVVFGSGDFVTLYMVVFRTRGSLPSLQVGAFSCFFQLFNVGFCLPSSKDDDVIHNDNITITTCVGNPSKEHQRNGARYRFNIKYKVAFRKSS